MNEMFVVFLILNVITGALVYLGYLIAYSNRRDLITGYRENDYKDPEKYGKLMGTSIYCSALLNFTFSLVIVVSNGNFETLFQYGAVILAPPLIAALYGNIKYRH